MLPEQSIPGQIQEIPGRLALRMLAPQEYAAIYQHELDYQFGQKLWEVMRHAFDKPLVVTVHRTIHPDTWSFRGPAYVITIEGRLDYVEYRPIRVPHLTEYSLAELHWQHWRARLRTAWYILCHGRLDHHVYS